jgi:hypothetical protein
MITRKTTARTGLLVMVLLLVGILLFGAMSVLADSSLNLSGREVDLGDSCGDNCVEDVRFVGWCNRNNEKGWHSFWLKSPCFVEVEISYEGTARQRGETVKLTSGTWKFKDGATYNLTGGTVKWPPPKSDRCGKGVAQVDASFEGGAKFEGCLDDIPFPLIPKIWGAFTY